MATVGDGRSTRYRITEAGQVALRAWMDTTPAGFPVLKHPVALRLLMGHVTDQDEVRSMLEEYVAELAGNRADLAEVRESLVGADGPGATPVSYALGVVAGPSGLVDSLTGEDVILSLNGGVVEGRTAVGGDLVFTVNVAANGDVTLDQSRAVIHDDVLDPDEATSPATLSADNLITLTATITDGDGDTAPASVLPGVAGVDLLQHGVE